MNLSIDIHQLTRHSNAYLGDSYFLFRGVYE